MFKIIILAILSTVVGAEILFKNEFLMDNNGWRITGNKVEEPAVHQSYNLNQDMSHYIMFKDNLINSEPKNPSDRTLWYFESASIIINPNHKYESIASKQYKPIYPTVLTFTMTSFVGDFRRLNTDLDLVRIKNGANCIAFKAPTDYDGNMRTFNVPLVMLVLITFCSVTLTLIVFPLTYNVPTVIPSATNVPTELLVAIVFDALIVEATTDPLVYVTFAPFVVHCELE